MKKHLSGFELHAIKSVYKTNVLNKYPVRFKDFANAVCFISTDDLKKNGWGDEDVFAEFGFSSLCFKDGKIKEILFN